MELRHSLNSVQCLASLIYFCSLYWFSTFLFSCIQNNGKVPLVVMIENEVLLEKHLLRLLDLHVSLKRTPSDSFWKGHENLKINFFSQTR